LIKLESLTVNGFKNLKIQNLEFPPEGNILVIGLNESGKSSVFEAIFFALTSKLLVKKRKGYIDAIAFDKNAAEIDLTFLMDGIPARIKKIISKTSTGTSVYIEFWRNYKLKTEERESGKAKKMDPLIESFLGFDDQILLNSCFVKQKGLDGFLEEGLEVRKRVLNKLLNLEKISNIGEQYKKELKKKKIIEDYFEKCAKIEENKQKITSLKKKILKEQDLLKSYKLNSQLLSEINQLKDNYNSISRQIEEIDNELKKNVEIKQKTQEKNAELEKYRTSLETRKNKEHEKELIITKIETHKKDLNKSKDDLKKVSDQINQFKKNEVERRTSKEVLNKKREQMDKFDKWRKIRESLKDVEENISSNIQKKKDLKDDIKDKEQELEREKIKLQEDLQKKVKDFEENLNKCKKFYENSKKCSRNLSFFSNINKNMEQIDKNEREIVELSEKINHFEELQNKYQEKDQSIKNKEVLIQQNNEILDLLKRKDYCIIQQISMKEICELNKNKIQEEKDRIQPLEKRKKELVALKEKIGRSFGKRPLFWILSPIYIGLIIIGIILSLIHPIFMIFLASGISLFVYLLIKEKPFISRQELDQTSQQILKDSLEKIEHLKIEWQEKEKEIEILKEQESEVNNMIKRFSEYKIPATYGILKEEIKLREENNIRIQVQLKGFKNDKENLKKEINKIKIQEIRNQKEDLESENSMLSKRIDELKKNSDMELLEKNISRDKLNNKINEIKKNKIENDTKLDSFYNTCIKICKDLGISLKSYSKDITSLESIMENNILPIQKSINTLNFTKWNQYENFYKDYTFLERPLESFSRKIEDLKNRIKTFDDCKEKLESNKVNREDLSMNFPERYQKSDTLFNDDYKKAVSEKSQLEDKVKNLDNYFLSNNITTFEREKNDKEEEIKNLEELLIKLDEEIKKIDTELININKSIPKEYQDLSNEEIKKITKEITTITEKIKELETIKEQKWTNLTLNLKDILKMHDDEFNDPEKIKSIFEEELKNIKSSLDIDKKSLSKIIPNITDDSVEKSVINYIDEEQKDIGGLKKEIDNNSKYITKLKKAKKTAKLLEDINNKGLSYKDLYDKVSRERKVIDRAIEILTDGGNNIQEKVLPKTMENLTRILPILTADSYKDAFITDDYHIQVFDSKLGGYVERTLFSGGTNDQIALAIRLSFALATMGDENLKESFIFLDEPLGFFDDERKNALIDFLTSGVIAEKFGQRIVVSNFTEIKQYFDFVVELDNGKIINQYSTGTLDSTQYEPSDYGPEGEPDYLILESFPPNIEDGFCEIKLKVKNNSNKYLKEVSIDIPELNLDITPKCLYEFKPSEDRDIVLECNEAILEDKDILINANCIFQENGIDKSRQFKIPFKPKI